MNEISFQDFVSLEMPTGTLRNQVHLISRQHEQTARRLRSLIEIGELPASEVRIIKRELLKRSLSEIAQIASAHGWNLNELAQEVAQGIYDACPTRAALLAGQSYPGCPS